MGRQRSPPCIYSHLFWLDARIAAALCTYIACLQVQDFFSKRLEANPRLGAAGYVAMQALLLTCIGHEVKTWTTGPDGNVRKKLVQWQQKMEAAEKVAAAGRLTSNHPEWINFTL